MDALILLAIVFSGFSALAAAASRFGVDSRPLDQSAYVDATLGGPVE